MLGACLEPHVIHAHVFAVCCGRFCVDRLTNRFLVAAVTALFAAPSGTWAAHEAGVNDQCHIGIQSVWQKLSEEKERHRLWAT
jgi:hypothetical protein